MRIAITGANGFVGQNLCSHLGIRGWGVLPLVRSAKASGSIETRCAYKIVSYDNPQSIANAIQSCDVLVHNAGQTKAQSFPEMYSANVGTTYTVLESLALAPNIKQLIYVSSQAAGKPSYKAVPVKESDREYPLTWYGKSKLMAEKVIQNCCPIPYTIIRPASVYGPGDKDFLQLFRILDKGMRIKLKSGSNAISLIYIRELCDFIELCIGNPKAYGNIFYASDGECYTQDYLQQMVLHLLNRKSIDIPVPKMMMDLIAMVAESIGKLTDMTPVVNRQKNIEINADSWLCSIEKARHILGFDPKPNLSDNLNETIAWYRDKGLLSS